ncbi:hypothetical protein [Polaromonas hydrogenivorans]|uniref:CopL family metal-binding regulatory protein n=1 Tax=Polaromonas hydrogenivorans TaxID=335476 RepID=A0AAU7LNU6_9BURK
MRALFFVLMITLLLLRGWTGDAMANGMALASLQHPHQPQQSTTKTIASHAHEISAEDHFDHESAMPAAHDCAGHAADDAAPAADGHCQSCDTCQACHSVALTPAAVGANPVFGSRTRPHTKAARFASAEAAPGQKPPIS